jgi:site-specific DNA-adenine methylase
MARMPRMFPYFGSKYRIADRYPAPDHPVVIEPFCGSAGYSLLYPDRQIRLYDLDPVIVGVWQYLIKSSPHDILALPSKVIDVRVIEPQEARWLVGFWMQINAASPVKSTSKLNMNGFTDRKGNHVPLSFWGDAAKIRVARAVQRIKHWTADLSSYDDLENVEATWFVDPPYQGDCGKCYKKSNSDFDYGKLAEFCRSRSGQVIVCDQVSADWLPFSSIGTILGATNTKEGHKKITEEGVWLNRP